MEELRSTEILDKEIREDARKKAERILKNAETEAAGIKNGVARRIKEVKAERERFYSEKLKAYKDNCNAAVPLEKQRKEILFFDSEIQRALDAYFGEMGKEKKRGIIAGFLKKFEPVIGSKKIIVKYAGFSKSETESLIKEYFPKAVPEKYAKLTDVEAEIAGLDYGLIIEDTEHTFACKTDINRARRYLLTEKREEVKAALFGGHQN